MDILLLLLLLLYLLHLGDYSPPPWMKILNEPTSQFYLSPPTYREISKIIHKMKSSGSAYPLDNVGVIALNRCLILRSALQRIIYTIAILQITYTTNNIIPETWKRSFCVLI